MSTNASPSANHSPARRFRRERDAAVQAARRAAAVIRARAGTAANRRRKHVNDYVTETDERAQTIITEHLAEAFPEYGVLAEEGADLAGAQPVPSGAPRWIIDPIDGTTNFMHALPPYAVSIALQRGTEIVVGVVLEVAGGALYTAVRGDGAYRDGAPLAVSRAQKMSEAVVATGFPYRTFGHLEGYTDVLGEVIRAAQGVRRCGAASVDLARVAAGGFGAFFETGLSPWDVAAGVLLVEEAGGRVTDYRGRSPDESGGNGDGALFGGQVLATGGPLHEPMRAFVEPMQHVRE
jgi:myo-inositol-1(or 4)-monophosphatase